MKTLLNPKDKNEIISRIEKIKGTEKALWGKMNIGGMICHSTDQVKIALGLECKDVSTLVLKNIAKHLILLGMPIPKGKIKTVPELAQEEQGTASISLAEDKKHFINAINELTQIDTPFSHPAFGKMNKKQWNRLAYLHIDHHLKQFGI